MQFRKIPSVILAVPHINIFITITAKNVLSLNAKFVTQFHQYINVICLLQNISALTAVMPCFSGNNVKIAPSINAIMIPAMSIFLKKTNLISLKDYYKKLNPLNSNCVTNSANTISPTNNSLTLHPNLISISPISEIHSTHLPLF